MVFNQTKLLDHDNFVDASFLGRLYEILLSQHVGYAVHMRVFLGWLIDRPSC